MWRTTGRFQCKNKTLAFHGGRTMVEQRRYERVPFFSSLDVIVLPSGPTIPGSSFDISLGGVGLTTQRMLTRGQTVRIRFHLHNGANVGIDEDILGRVAYSQADEDGDRSGIEFLETIRETAQPVLAHKLDSL